MVFSRERDGKGSVWFLELLIGKWWLLGEKEWYLVKKEEGAAGGVLGGGSFLQREGVPVLGEGTKRKGVWLITSLNEGDGVIGR